MLIRFILIYVTISFESLFVLHLSPTLMRSNLEVRGMVGMSRSIHCDQRYSG
jgi:hypothetical protein